MKKNSEKEAHIEYLGLIESGYFGEFYPKLTWSWDLDKEEWLIEHARLKRMRAKFKKAKVFETE